METDIRKIRKELGLTQKQLADKIGVARETISYWEIGSRKPNLENYLKLISLEKAQK